MWSYLHVWHTHEVMEKKPDRPRCKGFIKKEIISCGKKQSGQDKSDI